MAVIFTIFVLGAIIDGAGEAKVDLLPGSRFLTELNARPQPVGTDMLIIAGMTSPWNENDITRWLDRLRQKTPDNQEKYVAELGKAMISMIHGFGGRSGHR